MAVFNPEMLKSPPAEGATEFAKMLSDHDLASRELDLQENSQANEHKQAIAEAKSKSYSTGIKEVGAVVQLFFSAPVLAFLAILLLVGCIVLLNCLPIDSNNAKDTIEMLIPVISIFIGYALGQRQKGQAAITDDEKVG